MYNDSFGIKSHKQINFQNYKKEILKKLMEICILSDSEALLTIVNPENKYIVFSSTKTSKHFIFKYLSKGFENNIVENYNLKDVTIIYLKYSIKIYLMKI